MKNWLIQYSQQAEEDLLNIYEYIAFSLMETETAKKLVSSILKEIRSLEQMPLRFGLYDREPWHSKGMRVMQIKKYLVFYLPVETQSTVLILRIMYGGRKIDSLLSEL